MDEATLLKGNNSFLHFGFFSPLFPQSTLLTKWPGIGKYWYWYADLQASKLNLFIIFLIKV